MVCHHFLLSWHWAPRKTVYLHPLYTLASDISIRKIPHSPLPSPSTNFLFSRISHPRSLSLSSDERCSSFLILFVTMHQQDHMSNALRIFSLYALDELHKNFKALSKAEIRLKHRQKKKKKEPTKKKRTTTITFPLGICISLHIMSNILWLSLKCELL